MQTKWALRRRLGKREVQGSTSARPCPRARRLATTDASPRVAYIMSRFPKLTETFVLFEILAVRDHGATVDVFPLRREAAARMHPEAAALLKEACFRPAVGWRTLRANLAALRRRPRAYFGALLTLLRATAGSARYLLGGLLTFPKAIAFADEMTRRGVTHVHAHFASHPAVAAFVIHRLAGIPYSFTAHGSDLHRDRHMLREKVSEASFVVAISRYNRDRIVAECGDAALGKTMVVHCGVDTQRFRPATPTARGGDTDLTRARHPTRLLCVGTLHEVKGQAILIEACRRLQQRGVGVLLELVGDGPDRFALQQQIRRAGLHDRVRLRGSLTSGGVVDCLAHAQVAVAPSVPSRDGRREGIPVALMEAMACGVPVVASRLSGIPELVEHDKSGLLVEPGDATALADAIELLCCKPDLRERLAREARHKVLSEFNLASQAAKLARLFATGGQA